MSCRGGDDVWPVSESVVDTRRKLWLNDCMTKTQDTVQAAAEKVASTLHQIGADEFRALLTDDGLQVDGCSVWLRPDTRRVVAFRWDRDAEAWAEVDVELPAGLVRLPDSGLDGWLLERMGDDVPHGAPGELRDLLTAERWIARAGDGSRWLVDVDEDTWLRCLAEACDRADA